MLPAGPAFCFDLETTSPDPTFARPVEVAAVEIDNGKPSRECYLERCNPGPRALSHPSYASAAEIHGIIAEDVAGAPPYTRVLGALAHRLQGRAVVTYNGEDYDLRIAPGLRTGPHVDVYRLLVKLREECPQPPEPLPHPLGLEGLKLSLGAMHALHQGSALDGAHSAYADAYATIVLLEFILDRWRSYLEFRLPVIVHVEAKIPPLHWAMGQPSPPPSPLRGITWEGLAHYTTEPPAGWSDWGPKFKRNKAAAWVCTFGKFKGWPIESIDAGYLRWILREDFPDSTKALIRDHLRTR